MKTGICTTDFIPMPADKLFQRLADMGFYTVQFSFSSVAECNFTPDESIELPDGPDDDTVRLIKDSAARHGVGIAAVNGTFNMAHPDPAVRDEGVRRYGKFLRAVGLLGCGKVSLCSGTRSRESLWKYHPDNGTPEAWSDMMATASRVSKLAERAGITLAVETEAANVVDTPEKARRMLDEAGSPALKMIIDCANLFHVGTAKPELARVVMKHAFELFGGDIVLAHGKDIRAGDGIDFCAAGLGIVDFDWFLELLDKYGYRGDMFLHGIYDEEDMPRAKRFFEEKLAARTAKNV